MTDNSCWGMKVPHYFGSWDRKFQGAKSPPMELWLPGVKVHGIESYTIRWPGISMTNVWMVVALL